MNNIVLYKTENFNLFFLMTSLAVHYLVNLIRIASWGTSFFIRSFSPVGSFIKSIAIK